MAAQFRAYMGRIKQISIMQQLGDLTGFDEVLESTPKGELQGDETATTR